MSEMMKTGDSVTESKIKEAKMLGDFIASFGQLMEKQIQGIRDEMGDAVGVIMNEISLLSDTKEEKKKLAEAVLVKRDSDKGERIDFAQGEDETFQNTSYKSVNKAHGADGSKISSGVQEAGGKFKAHMSVLENLDESIQTKLFDILGALSTDDVIAQKLDHIGIAMTILHEEITELLTGVEEGLSAAKLSSFEKTILEKVKISYTTVEEEQLMNKIFST